ARARRVDVHADAVTGALDLDLRHTGAVEARLEHVADLDVLRHVVGVTLTRLRRVGEPARHVVGGDAEAEAVRVDLLAHYSAAFFVVAALRAAGFFSAGSAAAAAGTSSSGVATSIVMWLVRFM